MTTEAEAAGGSRAGLGGSLCPGLFALGTQSEVQPRPKSGRDPESLPEGAGRKAKAAGLGAGGTWSLLTLDKQQPLRAQLLLQSGGCCAFCVLRDSVYFSYSSQLSDPLIFNFLNFNFSNF